MFNIEEFWVGLMEGGGSIQVNHRRKKDIVYRLVIKLKNTFANEKMLKLISKKIGGRVRISACKEDVIWVEDKKERIEEIIKIFKKYPPLTARKYCQLEFLKSSLKHNNVELYLKERDSKYSTLKLFSLDSPSYFPSWLSGFIEGEGCFSITAKGVLSFSIGQKNEKELIERIRDFFHAINNKVIIRSNEFYEIKIYNKESLRKIIVHCTEYPLQGEKRESLEKFKQLLKKE